MYLCSLSLRAELLVRTCENNISCSGRDLIATCVWSLKTGTELPSAKFLDKIVSMLRCCRSHNFGYWQTEGRNSTSEIS